MGQADATAPPPESAADVRAARPTPSPTQRPATMDLCERRVVMQAALDQNPARACYTIIGKSMAQNWPSTAPPKNAPGDLAVEETCHLARRQFGREVKALKQMAQEQDAEGGFGGQDERSDERAGNDSERSRQKLLSYVENQAEGQGGGNDGDDEHQELRENRDNPLAGHFNTRGPVFTGLEPGWKEKHRRVWDLQDNQVEQRKDQGGPKANRQGARTRQIGIGSIPEQGRGNCQQEPLHAGEDAGWSE